SRAPVLEHAIAQPFGGNLVHDWIELVPEGCLGGQCDIDLDRSVCAADIDIAGNDQRLAAALDIEAQRKLVSRRLGPISRKADIGIEGFELDPNAGVACWSKDVDTRYGSAAGLDTQISHHTVPVGLRMVGRRMGDIDHILTDNGFTDCFEAV